MIVTTTPKAGPRQQKTRKEYDMWYALTRDEYEKWIMWDSVMDYGYLYQTYGDLAFDEMELLS